MPTNEMNGPHGFFTWQRVQRIAVPLGVIASLATVLTLWIQIQSRTPGAEVQVLSVERLTTPLDVEGLVGTYSYNGQPVRDVWKLRLRFLNTGDATLVTEGPRQNVMPGSLSLAFPAGSRVLQHSLENETFPSSLSVGVDRLFLHFSQWRIGEEATYSVYLGHDQLVDEAPLPRPIGREIIDGDLIVRSLPTGGAAQPRTQLDGLPRPVPTIGRSIGIALAGIAAVTFFVMFLVVAPLEVLRLQIWRRRHGGAFEKYLEEVFHEKQDFPQFTWMPGVEKEDLPQLARQPWGLGFPFPAEELWKGFVGPICPIQHPMFESVRGLVGGMLLGLLATLAALALVATALPF